MGRASGFSGIRIPSLRSFARLSIAAAALSFCNVSHPIGGQFGMEFAIDAPWRLEPVVHADGQLTYPPIPITFTFHDTIFEDGRGAIASVALKPIDVGRLMGVTVYEMGLNVPLVTEIPVSALQEIEVKRKLSTKTAEPVRQVCRPALGQECSTLLKIGNSHEWHAVFWYRPKTTLFPGKNLQLKVTVNTVGKHSFRSQRTAGHWVSIDMPKEWTNYLVVHAGEAPLPRFSADWVYGDLHHHSQMTDNEGESAYSYRNDLRVLGALGLDFVFATDHASNGEQVDGKVDGQMEARDLNGTRFAAAKSILYGPDGANALIANEGVSIGFPRIISAKVAPQIYMGEELDAAPEMSAQEFAANHFLFGGGLRYEWLFKQAEFEKCNSGSNFEECKARYATPASPNTYFLWDDQGVPVSQEIDAYAAPLGSIINYGNWIPGSVKPYMSRQHLVYFPLDSSLNGTGWISSDTTKFGGGTKSLPSLVQQIQATGFAFLAHPTESLEPGSIAGPDVVPYTDTALTYAWRSPAILGLQLWNENDRYRSQPAEVDKTVMAVKTNMTPDGNPVNVTYTYRWPFPGYVPEGSTWKWQQAGFLHRNLVGSTALHLHHASAAWDRFLRKGVDRQLIASLAWLEQGEPRKWFAAAGSDSHGDWNYRRYGRPSTSNRWSDVPVGDTAIGNPRNLVWLRAVRRIDPEIATEIGITGNDGPRRYDNRTVIEGLRAGRFSITDGPALRIAVDRNRNGRIDDADFPMGSTFEFFAGEHIPLLIEWQSTAEFGPIDRIDVYVGNSTQTYAAAGHGARHLTADQVGGGYTKDASGALQVSLADAVGRFNRENLPSSLAYRGTAQVFLGPAQFKLTSADGALSYVRAVARTITDSQAHSIGACPEVGTAGSKCGDRFAVSNPIWARYRSACPTIPEGRPPRLGVVDVLGNMKPYIDANGDGQPDICTGNVPDPCADPRRPEAEVEVAPPVAEAERGDVSTEGNRGRDIGRLTEAAERFGVSPSKPVPNRSCQKLNAET